VHKAITVVTYVLVNLAHTTSLMHGCVKKLYASRDHCSVLCRVSPNILIY